MLYSISLEKGELKPNDVEKFRGNPKYIYNLADVDIVLKGNFIMFDKKV
ncbi:MAG: hypothetical protein ACW990_19285 [Promethearchaeota archaeon]